jgi:formylglycine-generating enzyme required for sulfatase activity
LSECVGVKDFLPIGRLTELESLDLARCPQIVDLPWIAGLKRLKRLSLRCCEGVKSLEALADLKSLETLVLAYCNAGLDLSPLESLTNLRIIDTVGGPPIAGAAVKDRLRTAAEVGKDYVEMAAGVPIRMVWVPGGQFEMGSADNEEDRFSDEGPVHTVTLGGFWISSTLVTQAQYEAVTGQDPSHFKGADRPVERVSWKDADGFCRKLSQKARGNYALPTEAQWEFACRAGSRTRYCFGDDAERLDNWAWYERNSEGQTHPAGLKRSND